MHASIGCRRLDECASETPEVRNPRTPFSFRVAPKASSVGACHRQCLVSEAFSLPTRAMEDLLDPANCHLIGLQEMKGQKKMQTIGVTVDAKLLFGRHLQINPDCLTRLGAGSVYHPLKCSRFVSSLWFFQRFNPAHSRPSAMNSLSRIQTTMVPGPH
jgi:hypothetical protein